ncbi:MAG: hypothetical protein IJ831_12010 [Spirochaetales bacterium]|nr:hypothetical protein [Spirochaetales bacterium]
MWMILLLLISLPLSSSALTYYPDRSEFALRTDDIYIDTGESEFYFQRGHIEAGRLSSRQLQSLYSPFYRKTKILGLTLDRGRLDLHLLYYPSLAEGFSYEGERTRLSFLVDRGGSLDDDLLVKNSQRGLWEGVRGEVEFEHSFWSLGATYGFFPSIGPMCVIRMAARSSGLEISYTRGEFPTVGRRLEEYIRLDYRSRYLDLQYSLGRGTDAVRAGTWRERYSREKATLKLFMARFTVERNGSYSSRGKRTKSSMMTLSFSSFDISLKDTDVIYIAYRSRRAALRIGSDGSWRASMETERSGLRLSVSFRSKEEVSAYVTYLF